MRDVRVTERLTIPASELTLSFARSGGPGGQNVNKVSSKVELRWSVAASTALSEPDRAWLLERLASRLTGDGTLIVTSRATRDQPKNREDALAKLSLIVRSALARPTPRRATRPTKGSKRRRLAAKRHRGEVKRLRHERPE